MGLRKVHEIDENGYYVRDVILDDEEGVQETPPNCIDIIMTDGLFKARFIEGQWVNGISNEEVDIAMGRDLASVKRAKLTELNKICNQTIMGKFSHDIDGVTYYFSNDTEAQANFEKCDRAFEKNRITEIAWTAYDTNENIVRILFDYAKFEFVYLSHLGHIQNNITKLRDFLMPMIYSSTTVEEVNSITW